jgi:hypothetical protein
MVLTGAGYVSSDPKEIYSRNAYQDTLTDFSSNTYSDSLILISWLNIALHNFPPNVENLNVRSLEPKK